MKCSNWTINALRKHLTRIIKEGDKRHEQEMKAQARALELASVIAQRALDKAEKSAEERQKQNAELNERISKADVKWMIGTGLAVAVALISLVELLLKK